MAGGRPNYDGCDGGADVSVRGDQVLLQPAILVQDVLLRSGAAVHFHRAQAGCCRGCGGAWPGLGAALSIGFARAVVLRRVFRPLDCFLLGSSTPSLGFAKSRSPFGADPTGRWLVIAAQIAVNPHLCKDLSVTSCLPSGLSATLGRVAAPQSAACRVRSRTAVSLHGHGPRKPCGDDRQILRKRRGRCCPARAGSLNRSRSRSAAIWACTNMPGECCISWTLTADW